jgi:hypothetical protein
MSKPILPRDDDDARWRLDVNRRLTELERGRRMPYTTQRGGAFELLSETGEPRLKFGNFTAPDDDDDQRYGIQVLDADGNVVFAADEDQRGLLIPIDSTQWTVPTPQSITSGTFIAVAETQVLALNSDTLYATGALIVPASTIAQCRVIDVISGQATSTIEVNGGGAGVNGNLSLRWEHPFAIGWNDNSAVNVFLAWQIRRSAGGGTITAYPPRGLLCGNSRLIAPHPDGLVFA